MPVISNPVAQSATNLTHQIIAHNAAGVVNIDVSLAEAFTINANDDITDIATTNWTSGSTLETRIVRVKAISAIDLTVSSPDQVIGNSTVSLSAGQEIVINLLNWPDV